MSCSRRAARTASLSLRFASRFGFTSSAFLTSCWVMVDPPCSTLPASTLRNPARSVAPAPAANTATTNLTRLRPVRTYRHRPAPNVRAVAPRIVVIGGGSHQWVPRLVEDVANTPTLHEAEIVLEDIDPEPLPRMAAYVEHVARVRGIPLTVRHTTDQRAALDGADHVVVTISTGGFESMRHDLDVPTRYGIHQSVGDTVGPGGISRCLRNVPVLVGIARDMQELCPDAWLLNITNPMTTLCRAVTKETSIRTVGLCHEVTLATFYLWLLLDVDF